jgi:hypothetical protein
MRVYVSNMWHINHNMRLSWKMMGGGGVQVHKPMARGSGYFVVCGRLYKNIAD